LSQPAKFSLTADPNYRNVLRGKE